MARNRARSRGLKALFMQKHGKIDQTFFLLTCVLLVVGIAVLSSASSVFGFERFGDTYFFVKRQLIFGVGIGALLGYIVSRVPYTWWQKNAFNLFLGCIFLLILVFIPGIGVKLGGARSWVNLGGFLLQPAEVVKLFFLIYLSSLFANRKEEFHDFVRSNAPFFIAFGAIAFLILLQPDLGSMTVIAAIGIGLYFVAGAHWKYLFGMLVAGAGAFFALIQLQPYRAARLTTFLNPELDPLGIGYHVNQALLAIGSGGMFGRGFGYSRQKFQFLPEVAGDSIFAVMAEELGFVLIVAFIILFMIFLYRGFVIAKNASDTFARYTVAGIMIWFGFQAIVNMGAMVSLLPLTGVTFPLLSYGSSSMAINLIAIGIVLNVSRYEK